jgi:hypothetical protein
MQLEREIASEPQLTPGLSGSVRAVLLDVHRASSAESVAYGRAGWHRAQVPSGCPRVNLHPWQALHREWTWTPQQPQSTQPRATDGSFTVIARWTRRGPSIPTRTNTSATRSPKRGRSSSASVGTRSSPSASRTASASRAIRANQYAIALDNPYSAATSKAPVVSESWPRRTRSRIRNSWLSVIDRRGRISTSCPGSVGGNTCGSSAGWALATRRWSSHARGRLRSGFLPRSGRSIGWARGRRTSCKIRPSWHEPPGRWSVIHPGSSVRTASKQSRHTPSELTWLRFPQHRQFASAGCFRRQLEQPTQSANWATHLSRGRPGTGLRASACAPSLQFGGGRPAPGLARRQWT